jgi:hypothetical protein
MSEKKRQKKDGQDTNKKNRRMRAATRNLDVRSPGRDTGRSGQVKTDHLVDSVSSGYSDRRKTQGGK